MEYEMLVNIIAERIGEYLPEEWKDVKVSVITNDKINCKKTGISFERSGRKYSPTVYMEEYYERFQNGWSLEEVLKDLAQLLMKLEHDKIQFADVRELLDNPDNIFFDLINTRDNEELLKTMPHREFMDLSVVYRIFVSREDGGMASLLFTEQMAKYYGYTEEQLYGLAYENTRKLFPVVIKPMEKIMGEIIGKEPVDKDNLFVVNRECNMHVISNDIRTFGANVMLYPEEIHKLSEALGEDLYLIPSSRQEVVAIPKSKEDLEYLADLVYEMNITTVPLEDRLSHQIYQYDRDAKEITMATNRPYRSLVEKQEEPNIEKEEERSTKR